jgi:hypothetical protein
MKATTLSAAMLPLVLVFPLVYAQNSTAYNYTTKFGQLQFLDDSGRPAALAAKLALGGKVIFSVEGIRDQQGNQQALMTDDLVNPVQNVSLASDASRRNDVKRMIVSIGPTGNCIKRFVILDFSGAKPFVSEPFAYNPDDRFCERLKKVKWGAKETYIDLAGPQRYVYRTYGAVTGPVGE